jgi:hypothetical protein
VTYILRFKAFDKCVKSPRFQPAFLLWQKPSWHSRAESSVLHFSAQSKNAKERAREAPRRLAKEKSQVNSFLTNVGLGSLLLFSNRGQAGLNSYKLRAKECAARRVSLVKHSRQL